MIFATVGTHVQPFPRFLRLVEELDEEVVVQYGHNPPPQSVSRAVAFLPFDEVLQLMRAAEAVVTHAGVGSVLCALDVGQCPIVVPRLQRLGEHVDDHQAEFARELDERDSVVVLGEGESLGDAIARAAERRRPGQAPADGPLHVAVRKALRGERA